MTKMRKDLRRRNTVMAVLTVVLVAAVSTAPRIEAFSPPPSKLRLTSRNVRADQSFVSSLSLSERSVDTPSTTAPAGKSAASNAASSSDADQASQSEFQKGFTIIAFITLLNASLAPVWHAVYATAPPPPLFLNAIVSLTALGGLLAGGPLLDSADDKEFDRPAWSGTSWRGGMELGFWKGLGTTCHIYGMALTTANHGAFLLQLTTLIVPVLQAFRGERLPRQIQVALVLALAGIYLFSQDPARASEILGDPSMVPVGDALVLGAAFFYSIYDIQTFYWGREVPRKELVTIKVGFQAVLSCLLCAAVAGSDVQDYLAAGPEYTTLIPTVLWSGLIVNALATFLQVGGMQAVGPTRAQTIFASQPLWASGLNWVFLGSTLGIPGLTGGAAFLGALFLAATAEAPVTPGVAEEELEDPAILMVQNAKNKKF